jgi:predicted metal-dependent peptidase
MFDLIDAKARHAAVPGYTPSADEEKFISEALAYLVVRAPFWAHMLYAEMRIVYTDHVPIAATDSYVIYVNVKGMREKGMGIAEVAFVIAHEISHAMFGDLIMMVKFNEDGYVMTNSGKLPYNSSAMNAAEDYRINAMLIDAKVGKFPSCGLFDKNISAIGLESGVEIYEKIHNKQGMDWSNFDEHLMPSLSTVKNDQSGRRAQAVAAAVQASIAAGHGDLPAAMQQLIGEILHPKVSWQDQLKTAMQRSSGDPMLDWAYQDRRLLQRKPEPMYFARSGHTGAGCVVIGYDTSGSCVNPETQQRFFSEMTGIVNDLNPAQLVVIWCDAKVQRVDDIDEPTDLEALRMEINAAGGAPGGGGTSFVPVFEEIDELGLQPDMLVYLTDTYGTFPKMEPDYPVIWASIAEDVKVPFGELVHVEL